MKPTKAELIERHEQLLKLDDVLTEHEKTAHFSMLKYGRVTACGTICCLAGFAGLNQWFMDRGFVLCRHNVDCYAMLVQYGDSTYANAYDEFFGEGATEEIFEENLSSVWPEAMQRVRDRLERIKAMPEEA